MLLPETSVGVSLQTGSAANVVLQADKSDTAWWFAVRQISEVFDLIEMTGGTVSGGAECITELLSTLGTGLPEVTSCVDEAIAKAIEAAPGTSPQATRIKYAAEVGRKIARKVLFAVDAYQAVSGVSEQPRAVRIEVLTPPPPPPPGGGVGSGDGDGADAGFIHRDPVTRSGYLVQDGKYFHIPNGGVFECLAASRVVWDNLASDTIDPESTQASCSQPDGQWSYSPVEAGGNVPRNVILREDSSDTLVSAWLINSRGEIQTIPNGGIYQCLAYANPVIWNVPLEKVNAWRPVGTAPASCG